MYSVKIILTYCTLQYIVFDHIIMKQTKNNDLHEVYKTNKSNKNDYALINRIIWYVYCESTVSDK